VNENINMVEALGLMDSLGVRPIRARKLNPFQASLGEVLLLGTYHNHKKLLICDLEQVPRREL
jgi:hypothetical protein